MVDGLGRSLAVEVGEAVGAAGEGGVAGVDRLREVRVTEVLQGVRARSGVVVRHCVVALLLQTGHGPLIVGLLLGLWVERRAVADTGVGLVEVVQRLLGICELLVEALDALEVGVEQRLRLGAVEGGVLLDDGVAGTLGVAGCDRECPDGDAAEHTHEHEDRNPHLDAAWGPAFDLVVPLVFE